MNTRNCPNCETEIKYSNKYSYQTGVKKNTLCGSCWHKKINEDNIKFERLAGKNNPSFGKKFSKERRQKISQNHNDVSGKNNPMFGKSFYDCWVEKYGKETADEKLTNYKKLLSSQRQGKKNSMFGKPAPRGSGNGWSGWYKGWYFRSLLELSYMIKVIERFNLPWKSAECKELSIPYSNWEGNQKTYFADFLIADKYLVECKPKKLHGSVSVQSKAKGAKLFCEKKGLTYKLRWIRILKKDEIKHLVEQGAIQFLPRYEEKYKLMYDNRSKT